MIARTVIAITAVMLLEGCVVTGFLTAGAVTSAAVDKGADQGAKYGIRRLDSAMQVAIASSAGPIDVGYAVRWESPQQIPVLYPAHSGMVEVVRVFGQTTTRCKDAIFTINDDHNAFTTTICRNDLGQWGWALAEPSTHR
jgi:RES domain-containing protein